MCSSDLVPMHKQVLVFISMSLINQCKTVTFIMLMVKLGLRARAGLFDATFATVQIVELAAGAVNIALLSLNMKAGMAMRAQRVRAGKTRA